MLRCLLLLLELCLRQHAFGATTMSFLGGFSVGVFFQGVLHNNLSIAT